MELCLYQYFRETRRFVRMTGSTSYRWPAMRSHAPNRSLRNSGLSTKSADLHGETEKVDPHRHRRAVLGERAARCIRGESRAFPTYWPFQRARARALSTGRRRKLEAEKFGSAIRIRTYNLLVNVQIGNGHLAGACLSIKLAIPHAKSDDCKFPEALRL